MTVHTLYALLYALAVVLSIYNLYEQVPRAWRAPLESFPALASLLIRTALVAWIVGSTVLVLVVVARWM